MHSTKQEDGLSPDRHRRRQAVLRLAHRVPGQHHHPRSRHPPRAACSTKARSTTPSWEYSLLRLNQLEYFEPLKVDQDSETAPGRANGTVDLLLKVKEKGKNSIGLNGGVSGLSGAFLGVNYQTNNFLGLGETLSVQGNLGNVSRQFLFGFTEPYVQQPPVSNVGFQIFTSK